MLIDDLRQAYAQHLPGTVLWSFDGLASAGTPEHHPQPCQRPEHNSTIIFPITLGCRSSLTSEGKEWIERLIHSPEEARSVQVPDLYAGRCGEVLRSVAAMRERGERVRMCDIQSPLGVAELMWDETFYTAMLEEPEAVHALLEVISTTIINFVNEFQRLAGAGLDPCGFPFVWSEGRGFYVADDTISMISPKMHKTFSVPYIQRLIDGCGPVHYHTCTLRKPYFANVLSLQGLRGLNWNPGNSDDPALIGAAFGSTCLLHPHLAPGMHATTDARKWSDCADEPAFMAEVTRRLSPHATVFWGLHEMAHRADACVAALGGATRAAGA